MREQHGLDGPSVDLQMAILLVGFFAAALRHAAVEQVLLAVHLEMMHRAGHFAGCATEGEFHGASDTSS